MIAYFDTSGLAKLVLSEPDSDLAAEVWDEAVLAACAHVGYVELHAALAAALRSRRLDRRDWPSAVSKANHLWSECQVVRIDDKLVEVAAAVAHGHAVSGHDAIHLAAAEAFSANAHMVTWDRRVAAAAQERGIPVIGTAR